MGMVGAAFPPQGRGRCNRSSTNRRMHLSCNDKNISVSWGGLQRLKRLDEFIASGGEEREVAVVNPLE